MKTREESMKRGEFLRSLGLSSATLMAYYCLGTTMTSCGSKEDDPDPGAGAGSGVSGTTTGNSINFTVDLTNSTYAKLKTAGSFEVIGDVLVAFTTSNGYVALSKICTHEGSTLRYRSQQNDLFCSSHSSEFSLTGAVEQGPATTALRTYKAAASADGNTLTVTV
ncbi:MAG TPA: Rieske (2Fe-2S) protein [Dyadobacter sp.]|jgi:cytochrome b6-f complex iron-sulfur subunit|nr:Rieske (2Fe-2S) protein [Dyadobacter sp.]